MGVILIRWTSSGLTMLKAKAVCISDGTTYEGVRVLESDDFLVVFIEGDDGDEILRMIPWHNVKYIDYNDPAAVKHYKALAFMAMMDSMEDVDEFLAEVGGMEVLQSLGQPSAGTEDDESLKSEGLTGNPYEG